MAQEIVKVSTPPVVKTLPCSLDASQRKVLDNLKPAIRAYRGTDWAVVSRERQATGTELQPLKDAGFHYIGEGMFRKGFLFRGGKCVLKTAKGEDGLNHMLTENKTWLEATDDLRPYLVPVHDGDPEGHWNTMPAVERFLTRGKMSREEHEKAFRTKALLDYLLQRKGWVCDDLHLGNIGRHMNMPIALDYGFGCERISERRKKKWEFEEDDIDWPAVIERARKTREAQEFTGMGPGRALPPATAAPRQVRVVWGGTGEAPPGWKERKERTRWFRQRQPRKRGQLF